MRFEVICTGYNCAEYVDKCVKSVQNQIYKDFYLHLINDGSTDSTGRILSKYYGLPKVTVHNFTENKGAAFRRMECIRPLQDESVCLLLGMDDELLPYTLTRIKREYDSGKWMTYGNWKDQFNRSLPETFEFYYSAKEHAERNYRKLKYRSTAPNTFKKFLFNEIPDTDFQLNGKWIDTTTESELMFSCLEMCGKEKIGVIKEPIYIYNRNRKGGTIDRTGQDYKMKVLAEIMKRQKKKLYSEIMKNKIVSVGVIGNIETLIQPSTAWELVVCETERGEDFYKEYLRNSELCERLIYISFTGTPEEKKRLIEKHKSENATLIFHKSIRVLNISSNDWANYSYYNAQSLKAVGVDVEGCKLYPHSFGYELQHPIVSREEMIKKINSGFDIIQVFNSDVLMPHYLQNFKGKVVIHHTGSSYRAKSEEINKVFNFVWKSCIALGEFEPLGAKNKTYITMAIDTDKMQPIYLALTKPYRFLHCPSNPKVKGTERIMKMFSRAGLMIRVNQEIIPHEQSWQRMRDCDIYVELFNPDINGDKYGSWGTTAIEAAALGKVVVTQNLSKDVYEKYYEKCPLILATDENDFIEKIKWLSELPEKELFKLQKAHRKWAVEKHSFIATGKKIKQMLEI